jgi:serine/threonine-protein kinase HipA
LGLPCDIIASFATNVKKTMNVERVSVSLLRYRKQMVFNVAIKNRDDHAKNFSFQLIDGEWKLSPAYDLLPS